MGNTAISITIVRIRPKFWWMVAMGVRDNHTKFEQETQQWLPGTSGSRLQNLSRMAKKKAYIFGQFGCQACPWRGLWGRAGTARTARYFVDQVPPKEPPSTPLPNALTSSLPQEHVPL